MTAHALARLLLAGPDLPVVIRTGSLEDEAMEVEGRIEPEEESFVTANNRESRAEHLVLA